MPIYEYTCKECGEDFEQLVRGDERPKCPGCGKSQLSKRWSVPAAHSESSSDGGCAMGECGPGPGACGMPPGGGCPGGMCGL